MAMAGSSGTTSANRYEESMQRDIDQIKATVAHMSGLVERALSDAVQALLRDDRRLAFSVILRDRLIDEQVISPDEQVVCILTGHELKDPDATVKYHTGIDMKKITPPPPVTPTGHCANPPKKVADDLEAICAALGEKTPD